MRKVLSKIIVCCILTSIFMPGVLLAVQTNNVQPIILQENTSQNALILDLKDAKDIKDLPTVKTSVPAKEEGGSKEVEAKVKLVKEDAGAAKQTRSLSVESLAVSAIPEPLETGI